MAATSLEYERLILNNLKEGGVVRITMQDQREYNSQRMIFYRALAKCKNMGMDTSAITSRKIQDGDKMYLEILYQVAGTTSFLIKNGEDFEPMILGEESAEEAEFKKWLLTAKKGE